MNHLKTLHLLHLSLSLLFMLQTSGSASTDDNKAGSGPYGDYLDCLNNLNRGVYFEEHGFNAFEHPGKVREKCFEQRGSLDPASETTPVGTHFVTAQGGYFIPDPKPDEISWEGYNKGVEYPAVGYVQKVITLEGIDKKKPQYMIYRYSHSAKDAPLKLEYTGLEIGPHNKEHPVVNGKALNIGQNDNSKKVIRAAVLRSLETLPKKFEDSIKIEIKEPMTNAQKQKGIVSLQQIINKCEMIDDTTAKDVLSKIKAVIERYAQPVGGSADKKKNDGTSAKSVKIN
jgi:hypothetical protein